MDRIIMHVDFNSYFASVEQQANPHLRGKPIAVGGKGRGPGGSTRSVVTTASREAKNLGVKTAMSTWEAKKICPELIIIPGDPQKYSEITHRFLTICRKHADAVELFSTDEAFLDISMSAGSYFGAVMIAQMLRQEIRAMCGEYCTVSIGIAPNKLVAKLASESIKPSGLTIVRPDDVDTFVRSQPLKNFCGLGPRIEKRLEAIGVTSIDTLRQVPRATLIDLFQQYGTWLDDTARGENSDELEQQAPPKSIGHSYTFPKDLLTKDDVHKNLLALADRVAWRLRRQGFIATRISVYARYSDFGSTGNARLLGEPVSDGLDIAKNAWAMLVPRIDVERGVRLLGISVSELRNAPMPTPFFRKEQNIQRVTRALDKVQTKFGQGSWQRASTSQTVFRERTSGWHYDHEL